MRRYASGVVVGGEGEGLEMDGMGGDEEAYKKGRNQLRLRPRTAR